MPFFGQRAALKRCYWWVIFPNQNIVGQRSEVDVYYATRPGDPAFEVPENEATQGYRGIFTEQLLKAVESPKSDLVESVIDGANSLKVITSRNSSPIWNRPFR